MRKRIAPAALLAAMLLGSIAASGADNFPLTAKGEVVEAWKDMRFGMFLCWGPVSLTGKEIGWSRGAPPWGIRKGVRGGKGPTPAAVYDKLYTRWKPGKFDAEAWVKIAKDAGQKYLIFLVKHHDGFCLYDTKLTDFKSTGPASAWKVDVMKAVAAACHKHDLKLIIYYSQPDWHHPDYLGKNHERYIKYLHGQVRELLTNYGKIDGLWFDNLRGHHPSVVKLWDAEKLFAMARKLQPHLIINNRCGLRGDFDTPEQHVGRVNTKRPWESCITLGTLWAWKPNDKLKPYTSAIRMLILCAVGDGNLALNTNPMPDGRIEPRQVESFRQIGKWMKKYGESIYGTRGGPFISPDRNAWTWRSTRDGFKLPSGRWWGGSTHKGKTVYLHILRWPGDSITLPPIDRKIISSSVLTGGKATVKQTASGITVTVGAKDRDDLDTIVKLEFDRSVAGMEPVKPKAFKPTNYKVSEKKEKDGTSLLKVQTPDGKAPAAYQVKLLPQHSPATAENNDLIRKWSQWKYGAFLCFNSNQFSGKEFCDIKDPMLYDPQQLDVKQWVSTFKAAGMTHAVLTARHTSGFLLWDSATTDFDVASSGNKTDVVKTYVQECRRQGLAPGFYYCLWGGKNCGPSGRKEIPGSRALILAQLHELATRNGHIPCFWLDMMNWAPADLTTQEIYDSLKNVNPQTVVIFNQHIQDGSRLRYFPTDVINGEMMPPPASGHVAKRKVGDKGYYLPFEFEPCSQSRASGLRGVYRNYCWFTYGGGRGFPPSRPFSVRLLYKHISRARGLGAANILLSCAPDHTGRFRKQDVEQLLFLGRVMKDPSLVPPAPMTVGCKATASGVWPNPRLDAALAFDDDMTTRWGGGPDSKSGWLAVDLGAEKTFGSVFISEAYDRIGKFELQIKTGATWRTFFKGTKIGEKFSATFAPVTARHVRLDIIEASDVPTIWEVQLLAPKTAKKRLGE